MLTIHQLQEIYNSLLSARLDLVYKYRQEINNLIVEILNYPFLSDSDMKKLELLIKIGNVTYNNLNTDDLPIEDGMYDLMVSLYAKNNNGVYPVGAPPINFKVEAPDAETYKVDLLRPVTETDHNYEQSMWNKNLLNPIPYRYDISQANSNDANTIYINKQYRNAVHHHPDLVGTFSKCKFVLNSQAYDAGVLDDPRVEIVERDFFKPLLESGIIDPNQELTVIAELKYDGVSVEADCSDIVESARSRGDTGEGVAKDMSQLLQGYKFNRPANEEFPIQGTIGVKFEAIINKFNLGLLRTRYGLQYKNCRTAIIGIQGASDGTRYRDLISLVPIATDFKDMGGNPLDRLVEIELLNKYYSKDEFLRYSVFTGNYMSILYQMKRYVEEAEYARDVLPFLYDGVVFEFYDPKLRNVLGRDNSIDRYKVAVKFNPNKKQTIFRGYKYSIGQDGVIVPMIYFDPVEFMGTIHDHTTGHSFNRFKELDLHVGDIVEATYVNDVIVYITKPDNEFNRMNKNNPYTQADQFPMVCPWCGSELEISESGRSIKCNNINCPGRCIKRVANMVDKLGIKGFDERSMEKLHVLHLSDLMELQLIDFVNVLGQANGTTLYNQLQKLKNDPIYDHKLIGALGFTSIAGKTWKIILNNLSLADFMKYYMEFYNGYSSYDNLFAQLGSIHGIGNTTIKTILNEMPYFLDDIMYMIRNFNIVSSVNAISKKVIRFTGCRDNDLVTELTKHGYDIDGDAGVTKRTDILLIPYPNYTQGNKYKKAIQYGVQIIPIDVFRRNLDQFL